MTSLWSVPMVVAAFLTWLSSQPQTIGDAAWRESLRRQVVGKSVRVYTNQDLPASHFTASAPDDTRFTAAAAKEDDPFTPGSAPASAAKGESWWRERITTVRAALERDELLVDALQSRINLLTTTIVAKDDPFQQAQLRQQLQKAVIELDRLEKQVLTDRQSIETIQNEARRASVPPGWIR